VRWLEEKDWNGRLLAKGEHPKSVLFLSTGIPQSVCRRVVQSSRGARGLSHADERHSERSMFNLKPGQWAIIWLLTIFTLFGGLSYLLFINVCCRGRSAYPRTERGSEQQTATSDVALERRFIVSPAGFGPS
jgi:hypothetical protein